MQHSPCSAPDTTTIKLRTQSHAHGRWARIGAGVGGRRLTGGAAKAPHREKKDSPSPIWKFVLALPEVASKGCRQEGFYSSIELKDAEFGTSRSILVVEKSMCFIEEAF